MEFRDLKTQYLNNKEKIDRSILNVLEQTSFIGGKEVAELEKRLSDYVGVKHCITCANGTDALQLALMGLGINATDAVFVPDFTFFASAEVIPWVGACPVFVDVNKETFNISIESLKKAIEGVMEEGIYTPKAVIAVDLFGQLADYEEIRKITEQYNMYIIEDSAQGFGGRISSKMSCSFGDISTTSFFPAKPLGCYGDGGAIFTDNDEWAELIKSYKVHGKGIDKYDNIRIGMNSRLDTVQAAVLLEKLDIFIQEELEAINRLAKLYSELLGGIVVTPTVRKNYYSSWAQYTIQLKDEEERQQLQKHLKEKGIPTMIYYGKPMHLQKAFRGEKKYIDLPITETLCKQVLSLPIHPYMAEEEVRFVCNEIKNCIKA